MSTPEKPYADGPRQNNRRRKMSRRKKSQQFQPDFHDLERRMMPATFLVNNPADSGASGTLRWAVEQADAATAPSTIDFNLGNTPQTITLTQGQLELSNTAYSITIDGPGASELSISGNDASRVFQIDAGVTATISDLTVTDGSAVGEGGGVLIDDGAVMMSGVAVNNNEAVGFRGPDGDAIPGAAGQGGGIFLKSGGLTLKSDQIRGNDADGGTGGYGEHGDAGGVGGQAQGGGLYVGGGSVSIVNTTFSQNRATGGEGGQGGQGEDSGGIGMVGGQGGSGAGGAFFVAGGVAHASGVSVNSNRVTGGSGGHGGQGGTGRQGVTGHQGNSGPTGGQGGTGGKGGIGGLGGDGGGGGTGNGGGVFVGGGALTFVNGAISQNAADGGRAGGGGFGGRGGQGGIGGQGGYGYAGFGGDGGRGGTGGTGGTGGDGGQGGLGLGGGLFVTSGTLTVKNATVAQNGLQAGQGGSSGEAGSGGAPGYAGLRGQGTLAPGSSGQMGYTGFRGFAAGMPGTSGTVSAGGLYVNSGTINLDSLTVAYNVGGVVQAGGAVAASDGLFASNYSGGSQGYTRSDYYKIGPGTVTAEYCLFGNTPATFGTDSTDLTDTDPDLAAPGNYGGPTQTIPLLPGSPAIGAGTAISGITTDQRGFALDSPSPDIGAFQTNPLVVNTTIDGTGSPFGDLSLRQAVNLANVLDAAESISFDPAVFATAKTITLDGNQLELDDQGGTETITGPAAGVTISGGGLSRVFQVDGGATATFSGLTIAGGSTSGNGGGLYNIGTTTLTQVTINDDSAPSTGGGIDNSGVMIVMDSTISGNSAHTGAGIENAGTMTVTDSTISDNSAHYGGAIDNPGTMTVTDSTISDNSAVRGGSGIDNEGTMTVADSTISDNSAVFGAGIFNQGTLTADNSTFDDDRATQWGGAVYSSHSGSAPGPMDLFVCSFTSNFAGSTGGAISNTGNGSISGCTFRNNSAGSVGGGGIAVSAGALTITNSTLADNSTSGQGGGILVSDGALTADNDTIAGNTASNGGGIANDPGSTVTIGNTIVADNTASSSGPDVLGTFASHGHNLVGKTDGSSGWVSSDLTGSIADPLTPGLGPLGNYGGLTETVELLIGSPAIGAGVAVGGVTTDERGITRPASNPDIGAFQTDILTVTTTADSGSGSLRQAILDADASLGTSFINFGIGTSGSQQTITPASSLPGVSVPVGINGWTQGGTGYTGIPLIEIDGASAAGNGLVLEAGSDGSVIEAIAIDDFSGAGIVLGRSGNTVANSWLEANAYGVSISSADNTIGGCVAAGNLISGNLTAGVSITGTSATGNMIAGNLIGTDITGESSVGNYDGIVIAGGASDNTVGGLTTTAGAGAGNVISGNTDTGVLIGSLPTDTNTLDNVIEGNLVGTAAGGEAALPNGFIGVYLNGYGTTVGGTAAGALNVISGNGNGQVEVTGAGDTDDVIAGNYVGLDLAGTTTLGTPSGGLTVESAGNTIGGTTAAARNVISGAESTEISLDYSSATDNLIEGNYIGTNASGTAGLTPPNPTEIWEQNGSAGNTIGGTVAGAGNLVVGQEISGQNTESMILTSNNLVAGNLIDSNPAGTAVIGQTENGIVISGSNNTVGGTTALARNVLPTDAIWLQSTAQDNLVEGNISGLDITGTIKLAQYGAGIEVDGSNNTIGGTAAGTANVIAGTLSLTGPSSTGNLFEGNLVGTDITGTISIRNAGYALYISGGASNNTIGGTAPGAGNVLSSSATGLEIVDSPGNLIEGNKIGTDITGTHSLYNTNGVLIAAASNTIGGTAAGAANIISGNVGYGGGDPNTGWGLWLEGSLASDNLVIGNLIGLDATGENTLGNTTNAGVFIDGAADNTIGGTSAGDANVISGNNLGVLITAAGATGNIVEGNLIGTDKTGTIALGNESNGGILLTYATSNTIGGTATGAGNVISGNAASGIWIADTSSDIVVEGNLIGTDITGTETLGNGTAGVDITGSTDNTIGGTAASAGNVISANGAGGVYIDVAIGNVIAGNLIGTNAAGTGALGNGGDGIDVTGGSTGNTIGGSAVSARNIISGNTLAGVEIAGTGTSSNVVAGNFIGTDITGTQAIDNFAGVEIDNGATANLIGTNGDGVNDAFERNVLSGNLFAGVEITGSGTDDNVVAGNDIGTTASGSAPLGNGTALQYVGTYYVGGDVVIDYGASNNLVGTSGQSADDAGERNIISGSLNDGVDLYGSGTSGNVIAGNYIGTNSAGTAALANHGDGVWLGVGVSGTWAGINTVYGTQNADQGNLIAGNTLNGVEATATSGNVVAGNLIGTDLTGTLAIANSTGINDFESNDLQIGGASPLDENIISGNSAYGIIIDGSTNSLIQGNLIGTNSVGTGALPNGEGILIYGSSTGITVGGTAAGARNVISGNTGDGVEISGAGTNDNTVAGNYIGTNATGTGAIANYAGVEIDSGATANLIGSNGDGGSDSLERNIVSGNSLVGIWITGAGTDTNVVAGNYVGTDVTGTLAVPNGTAQVTSGGTDLTGDGIAIEAGASDNLIGTNGSSVDNSGERNIVSGNDNNGVEIGGSGSIDNVVAGNFIGLTPSGTTALPNNQAGLLLYNGASSNTVGGLTAALRNVISGNLNRGIYIYTPAFSSTPATANVVAGNYLGTDVTGLLPIAGNTNDDLSIDLSPGNIIGGTVAGAGNVLDTGGDTGIYIYGDFARGPYASASGTLIAGNIFGLGADGVTAAGLGNAYDGIVIDSAPNTTIGGSVAAARNIISNNTGNAGAGILIANFEEPDGAYGTVVQGNFIGTDITGTLARGNFIGIDIEGASSSLIGTDGQDGAADALEGNLISGNLTSGIIINAASANVGGSTTIPGAAHNVVAGNLIGTNASGTAALGNGTYGVLLEGGTSDNSIGENIVYGAANADERNVISGNTSFGVYIVGSGTTGNVVQGDEVGTNVSGCAALGNLYGIVIDSDASGNTIGGATSTPGTGAGNLISGNDVHGVQISDGAADNVVAGNLIGLDAAGTATLANTYEGVEVFSAGAGNTIGGTAAGSANVLSGNTIGIEVVGTGGELIEGNFIGSNAAGTLAMGNSAFGIRLYGSSQNTIGGTTAAARNIISGNNGYGVLLLDANNYYGVTGPSDQNVIEGDYIGVAANGTTALPNTSDGVNIQGIASGNTIGGSVVGAGNLISGNDDDGVHITVAGNLVAGNLIGTNAAGNAPLPNLDDGIVILAASNTIGGTAAGAGNLVSGNAYNGIYIGSGDGSMLLEGNFIGTNAAGTAAIANGLEGIESHGPNETIGGTAAGAGNLISGNAGDGIYLGSGAGTTLIQGNLVGTNAAGTAAIPNGLEGISAHGTGNTIGGTAAGAGNIVSGNENYGIYLPSDSGSTLVQGNLVGTNAAGTAAVGNGNFGIEVEGTAFTIGGTVAAARNLISGNAKYGVHISGTSATANLVEGDYIGTEATGAYALGNTYGLVIDAGASGNTIGGTTAGSGNVISGNSGDGVDDIGANSNLIAGNWIGTVAGGTAGLANTGDGVYVGDSSSVTVGGIAVGAGNLVSGNDANGIEINDSTGILIQGNLIGLDQTGTLPLGNSGGGVLVDNGSVANTIGGPVAGGRNFIAANADGIVVTGTGTAGTVIAGNLIGTDVEGNSAVGNGVGIGLEGGTGTTIGGATILARNLISGNTGDGIDIATLATSTLVQGNYIGADQTGTKPVANAGDGISVSDSSGVTIGGTAQGTGNVISANLGTGVTISGAGTGTAILGNLIGTDESATSALGNGTFGVLINGSAGVVVGGTLPGSRNIISSNAQAGIGLFGSTTGALIEDNLIGTDLTGSVALGNGNGIQIDSGSSNNTIGGTAAGAGNTIAFSTDDGVDVDSTAGTGNEIRLNAIFSNTGLGIDLGGNGVNLNNSVGDTGPNDYENFPVITAVTNSGGMTIITGSLSSADSTTFAIDFYTLSSLNASGYGEGRYVLGSMTLTTSSAGTSSFVFQFPTPAGGARFVTATATDPSGNTSEFSQEFGSDVAPTAVIGFTSLTVNAGAPISFDGLGSLDPSGNPLSYSWSFGDGTTATGAEPTHTYPAAGTDTVTLTVNDGFGGINTATATVTVNDVAPTLTPDSYTAPLTYTTSSPGNGFGEAIATDYGNVAIGAPSANGTGAVYLYDGVPTDDGLSSTYVYGALIRAFADPNPEPGDEFGASLAVVGNELVVGAPGSSLSGPGDGVAYVFDANVDSTTFGDLLATLTIPDPGASNQAQFGAAVGTTNSNIVIGAPGNNGGVGEAYEFEGDTTQSDFGDLLLDIPNPTSRSASYFGAAVAGLGNDVIVGAPSVELAGAVGGVFLFDGTNRAEITSIADPDLATTTGFGSAVAAVGTDILIGSPDDNSGAGAAFLYAPPVTVGAATLLTRFVQPDGGGGNFGASVAGTQNTALIGAPGANLATSDAGAGYLFAADPTNLVTLGNPIAAVQEPTPTSGDAFGTAVGFDDGALIVGSAGAFGSGVTGAETVDLYQLGTTIALSSAITYATSASDSVILSGTFTDANPSAALTATINWGDGSASTVVSLPVGSYAFAVPHDYMADPASGSYAVTVTLSDAGGESTVAETAVTISDPAPSFAAPGLLLSSSSISENGTVTLGGTIVSPGGTHTNTVSINWGDGSQATAIVLPPGDNSFSTNHTYLNNPPGVVSGTYPINATVTDDEGKMGSASAAITVSNVPPQFTAADLQITDDNMPASSVSEGDTVVLSGEFTDPGTLDPHTVTINWGDGSTPTVLLGLLGQLTETTPGVFTYSAQHEYLYNPLDKSAGGAFNVDTIQVSVADDVSTTSADTSITVNEVPPVIQIESAGNIDGSGTIELKAIVTDLDPGATDTVTWTLTQNGVQTLTGTGSSFAFPNPGGVVVGTVSATVASSDGSTGTDSAQVVVIDQNQPGTTITLGSGVTTTFTPAMISTQSTFPFAGAANRVIVLVYDDNDLVNASDDNSPVELDGYGSNETLIAGSGNDLLVAGPGANSLVGGAGNDTLVSNGGDDTLVGGTGNAVFRINPGPDPLVIAAAGTNTLDFSSAALAITINLADQDTQTVDSAGDVVTLDGEFNIYIASSNGDDVTANDNGDLIYAGTGSTTINGGSGADTLVGGTGNDVIYAGIGSTTITGGSGDDSIVGGTGNDIIYAGTGTTTISSGSGADSIVGGTGNDIIYAGTGTITISSGSGADSVVGGTGNDIIYAGTGSTTITGGVGTDTLVGGTGNDVIYAGTPSTTITGGTGGDSIVGGTGNDIIYAGTGNTTITSGSGDDSIVGGTGNDVIYAGTGNTTINGGVGNDSIVGGTGNDVIYGGVTSPTINGGVGGDTIVGGTGNDIIYAGTGSTTITGGSGDDSIVGGTGNDIIYAGTGNTTITSGGGDDSIVGGAGNDLIYAGVQSTSLTGGTGNDLIIGGTGNDIIYASNGSTTINGGSGNDSIVGGTGNDIIYAGTGNTTITGGGGDDSIIGGTGNDVIYGGVQSSSITGGSGNDSIVGGTGNDIIYATNGTSTITGGSGNDLIVGGTGNDVIYAGTGVSTINGGSGADSIVGGTGNDLIYAGVLSSTITGGSGDDTIVGGNGNDIIYGGTGNDSIEGGYGAESIVGGSGNDVLIAGNLSSTLTGGSGNDLIIGGFGNDIIYGGTGNDSIVAGTGNDSITGGSGDDIIYGGTGDSTISAGSGDSTISGGGGNDVLTGGGLDSWLMFYGSTNMTLTNTTFTTSGGSAPASVSTISGFAHAVLAPGPGDFRVDASAFTQGGVMLIGGTGNDTLIGTSGPDTLVGGAGNDSLVGDGGNDTFTFNSGSSGNQIVVEQPGTGVAGLDFSQAPAGISINLSLATAQTVIPGILTLTLANPLGIDNVLGSSYNDTIIGNANDNTLIGAGGDDLIAGLGGNDLLEGAVTRTVYLDFDMYELPGQHDYTQAERDAIQAQVTADYAAFSYVFTQTQPQSGAYTTIIFNDPTLVGLEGGSATGIDWRDLDISGSTSLTALALEISGSSLSIVDGLQVVAPDAATVNVNNLLGGPGEPAATSADFIGLSATIAAHELGHLSGLEHGDSFGPIGSGIYAGVSSDLYDPPYPGPSDADETIDHIMASGASVNATLEDAINDPFFGEREAIKLSFGENGTPTNEETTPHYAIADAQAISLEPLVVPDTDLEGVDADQTFNVTAADVVGVLGLNSNGQSNTDYYSFTAQAGTLINLQVMSAVLINRPQGAFDTTLTVYDATGNVIAYNDDSFQDTDSTIIDLTLPSTGIYYVEVTSSSKPGEPTDQTGAYELFMYTFALAPDPSAGDSLYAGSGDDTIIAGSADDTITASPQDTISYGSGTVATLANAPYLDVSAGVNQTVDEGTCVTLTGSFLDPDDADTHTYDWHVVASSGQVIADGTGLCFTFTPGNAGTYTVTFTATGQDGGSGSASVVITSLDVPPVLTGPTAAQNAYAGTSQSFNLGTLATTGVGPFTDTVQWGDGQTSTFCLSGSGSLSLAHAYETGGTYSVTETVSEYDGGSTTASFRINVMTMAPTSTALTSSAASAVYGQSVIFTATVTGSGTPTGTVAFYAGANQIGTGTLSKVNGQDVATFSTTTLNVCASPYAITAVYGGDAGDIGSTSNVVNQSIKPYAFTYTIANDSETYGTAANLAKDLSATINTGVSGQTLDIAYNSTGDTTSANTGTYAITGTLSNGSGTTSNYTVTLDCGTLTVNPTALTVTASPQSKTYGQAVTFGSGSAQFTTSGLQNGQSIGSVTLTAGNSGGAATAAVGSYTITPSAATGGTFTSSNYTITYDAGTLTVNPAALTVTASPQNKTYGQTVTFGSGSTQFTTSGLQNGQSIGSVTLAAGNSGGAATAAVGTYTIAPSAATGGTFAASNYTITYDAGTLTVNSAALTVTASPESKTYGQTVTFGSGSTQFTTSGLQNGQSIGSVTLTSGNNGGAATAAVGTYTITPSAATGGTFAASNYTITYDAGTLTVKAAALTITANSVSKTYGALETFSTTAFTETGLVAVNGDSITSVTETSAGAPAAATVGTYPINPGAATGTGLGNYTITYVNGTLTVAALNWSSYGNIYVLDPTAGGALDLSGSASVNVTGNVIVDSKSSSAIEVSGAASVKATGIQVVGGVQKSGSPTFSPQPVTGTQIVADPLAGLAMPAIPSGLTNYGSKSVSGSSSATLQPGIYSQISVSGAAKVTLAAGTYVIQGGGLTASGSGTVSIGAGTSIILEGGGLSVSGAAAVSGTGVTIFNFGTAYNGATDGGTFGPITLSGSGSVSLTPATTGTYSGILFFQGRDNPEALTFSGAAMQGVTGMVYAPAAQLAESGSAQVGSTSKPISMVVDTLTLSGAAVANGLTLTPSPGTVAYTPAQIRAAYGLRSLALDGTGQTIAIVDAYNDPDIYQAVDDFDTQFGLTTSGPNLYSQYGPAASFLTVLNQNGQTTSLPATDPSGAGTDNWEVEEALDVEWAHAIAPGAQIILVEADSQSLSDLMASVNTAAHQPGVSVVSMSWGFAEGRQVFASDEATYDGVFNIPGVSFVASTGDFGAADPEYPAFSPNVVAVGGTSLTVNGDDSYNSETGWGYQSGAAGAFIGSGGGLSLYEPEPSYQQSVQSTGSRTTPDVSFDADPATGVWIADPYNLDASDPFEIVGGTSLSAPAWAGLLALVNQGSAAAGGSPLNSASPTEAQQALYNLPQNDFNVINSGFNGYTAEAGYNLVTGLGTPVANLLVSDLVAFQSGTFVASGPTVGPLQSSALVNTGGSSAGTTNVFSVFDLMTVAGDGLQYPSSQSFQTNVDTTEIELSATAINRAVSAPSNGFAPNFGVSNPLLSPDAHASSVNSGTDVGVFGVSPVTSAVATGAPAAPTINAKLGSAHKFIQPTADRAIWPMDDLRDHQLPATVFQDETDRITAPRRVDTVADSVLDELVANLVCSRSQNLCQAVSVANRSVTTVTGARVEQPSVRSGDAALAGIPGGPLSQSQRSRPAQGLAARLTDLFMVGGFCGFGTGLMAVRKPRAGSLSSRRSFLSLKNTPAR